LDTAFSTNNFAALISLIHSPSLGGGRCSRNIFSCGRYSNHTLDNMMSGASFEVSLHVGTGE
jgi:hypothetical protein